MEIFNVVQQEDMVSSHASSRFSALLYISKETFVQMLVQIPKKKTFVCTFTFNWTFWNNQQLQMNYRTMKNEISASHIFQMIIKGISWKLFPNISKHGNENFSFLIKKIYIDTVDHKTRLWSIP